MSKFCDADLIDPHLRLFVFPKQCCLNQPSPWFSCLSKGIIIHWALPRLFTFYNVIIISANKAVGQRSYCSLEKPKGTKVKGCRIIIAYGIVVIVALGRLVERWQNNKRSHLSILICTNFRKSTEGLLKTAENVCVCVRVYVCVCCVCVCVCVCVCACVCMCVRVCESIRKALVTQHGPALA